ncbi:1-acyl-sn-glycerol-3-phosphate acyltransferase [Apibacter muscae]|uniref:lysophospholipid acyltransferase family protein n=1 Tax=Apibacter muscae TaxID=2509004 RepID=UPI0011AD4041|nr:lysophospholipid acyltransferase family protein [Apibacter muscae]TWP29190.1 1-acyl-sn-glycerol-3-phosphate acyltransferase [Apibacter muscae]
MKKIIAYPLSIIYYLLFGSTLLIFHIIQWLCLNLFGYGAHKKSVDIMCFFLVANTYVLGTRYKVLGLDKIPSNEPLIIAANHQSLYDTTSIGWFFRKFHPKFISKIELGKGIPSISYNLTHGDSVLIDRKDPKQSLSAIKTMAEYIEEHNRAAVIFPEGTRSKTGKPGTFAKAGFKILCKNSPSAYVVPVTINNSWKMTLWGAFPMGIGNCIELLVHEPIKVSSTSLDELFIETENQIVKHINKDHIV